MNADTLLIAVVAVVMVIGLAGTVLPILPGLWLIWAAAAVYGAVDGLGAGGWVAMVAMTVLALGGTIASLYFPQRTAASAGVPWWGQLLAAALAIAGMFMIPVVGAPLGFVAGILVVTIARERRLDGVFATTWATVKSMLVASGLQLVAGVTMVSVWVIWVWAD